jgi:hypothetical protein
MNGAWVNRRRGRYFLGPYSDTREITIIGPPPYIVLREPCSADEVGRASRAALNASVDESVSADDAFALAERRVLELAHLAGVKDRATFERGTRLVELDQVADKEILVKPFFRKRGYWEPTPEVCWLGLQSPSDRELGEAVFDAIERASA